MDSSKIASEDRPWSAVGFVFQVLSTPEGWSSPNARPTDMTQLRTVQRVRDIVGGNG